jgi:hypothetical protein
MRDIILALGTYSTPILRKLLEVLLALTLVDGGGEI